jgi:hypothetical protein
LSLRSLAMRGLCFHTPVGGLIAIYPESMRPADPTTTFSSTARITAVFVTEQ